MDCCRNPYVACVVFQTAENLKIILLQWDLTREMLNRND